MQLQVRERSARWSQLEGRHPCGNARTIPDIVLLKITTTLSATIGIRNKWTMRARNKTRFRRIDVVANRCGYASGRTIAGRVVAPRRPGDDTVARARAIGGCHTRSRSDVVISFSAQGISANCQVLRATARSRWRTDRDAERRAHPGI